MGSSEVVEKRAHVHVENIGGISETDIEFSPGVTVLAGRNATNRTSFLRSLMAALGSDDISLKADAEQGSVTLSLGEKTYTRTLERGNGTVHTGGDPYLDDPEVADLFAFLLESNEARRAVARGDDLRELVMRPVDVESIREDIDRLEREKRQLDEELDELDSLSNKLPRLEQRRSTLTSQIEEKREELAELEAEIEETDASVQQSKAEKQELEAKLDELSSARDDLESVRFDLETERESLESLREDKEDLEARQEELQDTPEEDVDAIERQLDQLRERKRTLDATVKQLQSIIQFNEEMLEGTNEEVLDALRGDADVDGVSANGAESDGGVSALTDQLVESGETVVCWTCGSEVERTQIEETVDRLRSLRQDKLDERRSLTNDIDDLSERRSELESTKSERERVERRLNRTESEMERRTENIEELEQRREDLAERVEDLEADVESLEDDAYSEILDLHKQANELEFEIERLESDRADVDENIESIEESLAEQDDLEARREEVNEELQDRRTRIAQLEEDVVSQFNDHMEKVLDLLGYENIDRIWIERTEQEVREGRRKVTKGVFDMHIIRRAESGASYEDTIDHLSESEREVTGLVFALAGYLVHDVHETMPFMLLDSLEAVDSDRIASLIDYFREYAPYLVVALLPEDASALDEGFERVTQI